LSKKTFFSSRPSSDSLDLTRIVGGAIAEWSMDPTAGDGTF
jgi:hypothetical protein